MCPLTSKSIVVAAAVRPQRFLKKVIPRGCIFKTCAILAPLGVYMVSFPSRPNLRPVARHPAGEASRPARLCPGSQSMLVHVKKSVNKGSIKDQSRQMKKQRTSHGHAPLPPALDVGRSMLSVGCLPFPQQSRQIKATDVFLLAAPSSV